MVCRKDFVVLENEILHSMLNYPADISRFLSGLKIEVFSKPAQEVLKAIIEAKEQDILSTSVVRQKIKNKEYFLEVLNAPTNPNYINYRQTFINEYLLMRQEKIANEMLKAAQSGQIVDIDIYIKSEEVKQDFKNIKEWQEWLATCPMLPKFKVNIDFLDLCFDDGMEGGQLVLISGDPEAGKTMLGLQMIENIAKYHKVAFFCFEFTIQGYLKTKQKLGLSAKQAENIIVLNEGYDINEIAYTIKTLYKQGLRVFFIDSQMRITSPQGRNMEEEESLKFSTLARLCHSLGILIFLVVQTSKGDRDNPMGSKKGGHEASIIIRVERTAPEKDDLLQKGQEYDENARIILVKKNKQTGRHFKEKVFFDTEKLVFFKEKPQIENFIDKKELDKILKN